MKLEIAIVAHSKCTVIDRWSSKVALVYVYRLTCKYYLTPLFLAHFNCYHPRHHEVEYRVGSRMEATTKDKNVICTRPIIEWRPTS